MSNNKNVGFRQVVLVSFITVSMLAFVVAPALTSVYAQVEGETSSSETTVESSAPSEEPAPAEVVSEPEVLGSANSTDSGQAIETSPVVSEVEPFDTTPSPEPVSESTPLTSPTLTTDKDDYHLWEDVNIFGKLFQAFQEIAVKVFGTDPDGNNYTESTQVVTTDEEGSFLSTYKIDLIYRPIYTVIASAVSTGLELARTTFTDGPPSVDLEQCRNGAVGSPNNCVSAGGGSGWVTGNVGASQGHYVEGHSIPYRAVFKNLPVGPPVSITLGYDIKHSGAHAIDYLTHFERLNPHTQFGHGAESVTPTSGVSGVSATTTTFAIPAPSSTGSPVAGQPTSSFNALPAGEKVMTLYGGTITNVVYATEGVLTDAQSETRITVTFTADSADAVLAWGGHIATAEDWGAGNSAGGISGSPYHMRTISWNLGNLGNQDRSLSAAVILVPQGIISGVKFNDANGNGINDAEAPIDGWTIFIDENGNETLDVGETSTITAGGGIYTFADLVDGTYSICEVLTPGWTQTLPGGPSCHSVTITGGVNSPAGPYDFGNTEVAHLTLVKVVNNDSDGTSSAIDWTLSASGPTSPISGVTGSGDVTDVIVDPGTYNLSESGPVGYTASDWVCIGVTQDDTDSVTLAAGDDVTCTITNSDNDVLPSIEVTKTAGVASVNEPGDTVTYTFTVKNLSTVESVTITSLSDDQFGVLVGDADCQVTTVLGVGATCEFDAAFPIVGDAGDTHTNVFTAHAEDNEENDATDTDDASVTFVGSRINLSELVATNDVGEVHTFTALVEKNDGTGWVDAANEHVDFTLTPVGATPVLDAGLSTCDDAGANTDLNGECVVVFNSATPGTVTMHAEVDVTVNSVLMHRETDGTLGSGVDAVKTYIAGKIIVNKVTVGGDGQFIFDTDYSADFQLGNGGSNDSGYIPTGVHSVSEVVPAGWDLTSAVCDDGSEADAINLEADETVTCVFTNTKQGKITIKKDAIPNDSQDFEFTFTGQNNFLLDDDLGVQEPSGVDQPQSQTFNNLTANNAYTSGEILPLLWEFQGVTCVNDFDQSPYTNFVVNGTSVTVTLDPGAEVTCTFTNFNPGPTRTLGFWQTHTSYASTVFSGFGGTLQIGTKLIDTNNKLFAGFYAAIAKKSTGAKRTPVDQARMQLLQQWLAAQLNCEAFGCGLATQALLTNAETAWNSNDKNLILSVAGQLDVFNNSGDTIIVVGTPGPATPKASKDLATSWYSFWDSPLP